MQIFIARPDNKVGDLKMQREYDKNNIFAKIIRDEIPSEKIYEDDTVLAFRDINPAAPVHILVIPKKDSVSFNDFVANSTDDEVGGFFRKIQEIAKSQGLESGGYRIVANCGEKAGQMVFHFHVHLMGYK